MKKIIFIFFSLFIIFSCFLINNYYEEKKEPVKLVVLDPNIKGNIRIPNTNINNYVVQGKDNDYYLTHNYKDEESIYGSIYLDFRNTLTDKRLLLYGHNSKILEEAPFKDLEKYKDYNFYKENPYIYLTLNNYEYTYQIFSVNITTNTDYSHTKINYTAKEFTKYIKDLIATSLYNTKVKVLKDDFIITLQTCNYNPDNTYLLINAKRVDNI